MLRTFRIGGIHPPENNLSAGKKITALAAPKQVIIPLSQHIGAPAQAVVKKRRVLVGTTPLTQSEARVIINEEVADVLNCVESLEAISIVDRAHVSRIQAEKLERWDRRTMEDVT